MTEPTKIPASPKRRFALWQGAAALSTLALQGGAAFPAPVDASARRVAAEDVLTGAGVRLSGAVGVESIGGADHSLHAAMPQTVPVDLAYTYPHTPDAGRLLANAWQALTDAEKASETEQRDGLTQLAARLEAAVGDRDAAKVRTLAGVVKPLEK